MRAVWYDAKGPAAEVLQVGEVAKPKPGPGEVLVAVKASGINPSDTKGRGGARGNIAMPFPRIIPHQDGAGIISSVGSGVPASRIGERVWLYEAQLDRAFGTAADFAVIPASNAVPLPAQTGFIEASCLGVPAMTAHRSVFADGPVRGKTVLVAGGAGAVGGYAIQFAKHDGARVIATVSSDEQAERAKAFGADLVVNRHSSELVDKVPNRSVDRIVEVAFGANLEQNLRILADDGAIATYASDLTATPAIPFWSLAGINAMVRFVLVYTMTRDAHDAAVTAITDGLTNGWLRHDVGAVFGLDEIAAAHELVESGGKGNVVIDLTL